LGKIELEKPSVLSVMTMSGQIGRVLIKINEQYFYTSTVKLRQLC